MTVNCAQSVPNFSTNFFKFVVAASLRTVGQNNQKYRLKYWATRSSVRSFARTAHSFACSGLLALLASSAVFLARSLRSRPRSWDSEYLMSQNDLVCPIVECLPGKSRVPVGGRKEGDWRRHSGWNLNEIDAYIL